MQFIGTPYLHGGNSPMDGGMDCSGLVLHALRAAGEWGRDDARAQDIYNRLEREGSRNGQIAAGYVLFFGDSVTRIEHVAFAVSPYLMIESGGGDHTTTTIEEAARRQAMVRLRLIASRSDLVASIRPRYARIGLLP